MTRPASSSSTNFRAMHCAGQATKSKLNFFLDGFTNDGISGV